MKVAGIVCEYNPMHNGHVYQIEKTRQGGATHIVCAMSGNFVQRGEPAYLDKWARAETAIKCGADLVVEIPVPWAVSGAESFARGGMTLLNDIGIDMLSFGCENGDATALLCAAKASSDERAGNEIKAAMRNGATYPSALQSVVEKLYGREISSVFSSPNNVLAVEYIKLLSDSTEIFPVERIGVKHDEKGSVDSFMSASALRRLESTADCKLFVPSACYEKLESYDRDSLLVKSKTKSDVLSLYALRMTDLDEMKKYVTDSSGLAEKIFVESKKACSIDELYANIKTKNFTLAKIRREILNIVLKIPNTAALKKPPYIKVLATNSRGLELLSRSSHKLLLITKHSEIAKADGFAGEIYEIQCRSTDVYCLLSEKHRACSKEQTSSMLIIK